VKTSMTYIVMDQVDSVLLVTDSIDHAVANARLHHGGYRHYGDPAGTRRLPPTEGSSRDILPEVIR
jgi:hypothetical protein